MTTLLPPDAWARLDALFHDALELAPGDRAAWLDRMCGDDAPLRHALERLLASAGGAEGRVSDAVQQAVRMVHEASPPARVGPYEIGREIGRGGMGVVYLAVRDDGVYRKEVAVKIVKRGMDTDLMLGRFERERRILARLEHPFIVRIIDGGSTADGRPYLVMDHVRGTPITEYCRARRLGIEARLDLCRKICEAVQHAHRHLVIHRDLKPSNVLINEQGEPRLLDFGVAKLLDPDDRFAEITLGGAGLPLTPQYASPEQVRGEDTTTATDVYALGAILYELLTGQTAHRAADDPVDVRRIVCDEDITKPSVAARAAGSGFADRLTGDLDNILMMALDKSWQARYGSVEQFSEDLRRYLDDQPVVARPPTRGYRLAKSLRRNRGPFAAAAAIAAVLVAGLAVASHQAARADRRFTEVRQLANAFIFDIDERLQQVSGSTEVRRAIMQTSLEYLDGLARESAGDTSLLLDVARAYQKVGDVYGYGRTPNLGQPLAALDSHRKALDIGERLAARYDDPGIQRLVARGHQRVGALQRAVGQNDQALTHFRQGLTIAAGLDPTAVEDAQVMIELHSHLGESEFGWGNVPAAITAWQRTLEIGDALAAGPAGDGAGAVFTNPLRVRASRALQMRGDLDGALEHARQAIASLEHVTPHLGPAARRLLLNSYEQIGFVMYDVAAPSFEDTAGALAFQQRALAIAEELSARDPNDMRALSDLAISRLHVCEAQTPADPAAAEHVCRAGLDAIDRVPGRQLTRPFLLTALGGVLHARGRLEEALDVTRQALVLQEEHGAVDPSHSDWTRLVIRVRNQLGLLLFESGDPSSALDEHTRARTLAESLLPRRPADPALRTDLSNTYDALAFVHQRLASGADRAAACQQAQEWYRKSAAVWHDWPTVGVSSRYDTARITRAAAAATRCAAAGGD